MADPPGDNHVTNVRTTPDNLAAFGNDQRAIAKLPHWFRKNCIKTASELKNTARIVIRDSNSAEDSTPTLPNVYEIESCIYQSLLDLVQQGLNREPGGDSSPITFVEDAVLLRVPGPKQCLMAFAGEDFLRQAVTQFASDIDADLVVMDTEDLQDLAEHFLKDKTLCKSQDALGPYFDQGGGVKDDEEDEEGNEDSAEEEDLEYGDEECFELDEECFVLDEDCSCLASRALRAVLDKQKQEKHRALKQNPSVSSQSPDTPEDGDTKAGNEDLTEPTDTDKMSDVDGDSQLASTSTTESQTSAENETSTQNAKSTEEDCPGKDRFDTLTLFRSILGVWVEEKQPDTIHRETPTESPQSLRALSLNPIVVLLPNIFSFDTTLMNRKIFSHLKEAAEEARTTHRPVILVGTIHHDHHSSEAASYMYHPMERSVLENLGSRHRGRALQIFPLRSPSQASLFQRDVEPNIRRIPTNIRLFQRAIRRQTGHLDSELGQPYADWEVPQGSVLEQALRETFLSYGEVQSLTPLITRDLTMKNIRVVIERDFSRKKALERWVAGEGKDNDQWKSKLPPRAWPVVQQIMRNKGTFEMESKLLHTIVNPSKIRLDIVGPGGYGSQILTLLPDEIHTSWSDIELEPDTKSRISRLLSLLSPSSRSSRILKRGRVGGALLYAPPGTGKTYLARVLAKGSSTVMLHISAASIQSKWVGETEKTIQALFRLGKMLFPSIIFIDEADALFFTREMANQSWEISKVNQLLGEVDGISKDPSTPFLMLATNYPGKLDQAVLRRVPCRIYLGLPSAQARENIFKICLRDEAELCPTLDLGALAAMTHGYTGSDIEFVCNEAAMRRDDDVESSQREQLPFSMSHFVESLKRNSPTVSKASLRDLKSFAAAFDRPALERMTQTDEPPAKKPRRSHVPPPTPSTVPPLNALMSSKNAASIDGHGSTVSRVLPSSAENSKSVVPADVLPPPSSSIYQPLDKTRPEIRLIELVSDGSTGGEIRCQLHTVSLAEKPTYTALSYVWGDATKREQIWVNKQPMAVTVSLTDALRSVKCHWQKNFPGRPETEFRLWADALCIDQRQSAIHERNHQVRLMGDIYSGAELTLSSVAMDNSVICRGIDIYSQMFDVLTNSQPLVRMTEIANYIWLQKIPSLIAEVPDEAGRAHCHNDSWEALLEFWSQPYWTRVWIVQEMTLSKTVILFCGKKSIWFKHLLHISSILRTAHSTASETEEKEEPDEDFLSKMTWCKHCYDHLFEPAGTLGQFLRGFHQKKKVLGTFPPVPPEFLFRFCATDKRDHVYGLLDLIDLDLEVDYQKSVEEVFRDFVHAHIEVSSGRISLDGHHLGSGTLSFLQFSGLGVGNVTKTSPSWLPDFSTPLQPSLIHGHDERELPFSHLSGPERKPEIHDKVLKAHGAQILRIEKAEKAAHPSDGTDKTPSVRIECIDFIRDIIFGNEPSGAKMPLLQAILRAFTQLDGRVDEHTITKAFHFFKAWDMQVSHGSAPSDRGRLCEMLEPDYNAQLDPHTCGEVVDWFLCHFFPGQEHLANREVLSRSWHQNADIADLAYLLDNTLFQTTGGYIGLGRAPVQEGDLICCVDGCCTYLVFRQVDNHYLNLGSCFISDFSSESLRILFDGGKVEHKRFEIW